MNNSLTRVTQTSSATLVLIIALTGYAVAKANVVPDWWIGLFIQLVTLAIGCIGAMWAIEPKESGTG